MAFLDKSLSLGSLEALAIDRYCKKSHDRYCNNSIPNVMKIEKDLRFKSPQGLLKTALPGGLGSLSYRQILQKLAFECYEDQEEPTFQIS